MFRTGSAGRSVQVRFDLIHLRPTKSIVEAAELPAFECSVYIPPRIESVALPETIFDPMCGKQERAQAHR